MDYLDAWREGYKEGIKLVIAEVNKYCGTKLETSSDLIDYIQELKDMNHV
ncbi:hypothetical protein UFOVP996_54 [uncultured Caudovirales phage]|jgi:hypothetical protein|uniref:Uncharacterized protein n=1 Tax=uncultured Caudovirales phage TaxID=2100421 RepID=A0A6J5PVL8_9CAUD|nr:hypothetical protein UFOVP996_54 [uncultured Caudovirales phage]